MKKTFKLISVVSLFFIVNMQANAERTLRDTLRLVDFVTLVKTFHPVARQITLIGVSADASLLAAKGNFDPKIFAAHTEKNFLDKRYFSLLDAGLKISTLPGVEFKTGFENNSGYFLNPENNTPAQGLVYSQISVPLLQGLITDERRTILRQAQLAKDMSKFEMNVALNELYYKAAKAYLDWVLAEQNLGIYRQAYLLSKERKEATIRNVLLGDRAGIDSVEASIQMQDRYASFIQAENDLRNAKLNLSLYLWNNDNQNMIPTDSIVPENINEAKMLWLTAQNAISVSDNNIKQHPVISIYDNKIMQLNVENRWKKEKLKPVLNVFFNPLTESNRFSAYAFNQNKWGLTMNFPLLLRKERGELRLQKAKILSQQMEKDYKERDIQNKISLAANDIDNYVRLANIQSDNLDNYRKLWLSEKKMFELGESSLFMVNARENNFINAGIKLNEIIIKKQKAVLEFEYAKGSLWEKLSSQ